MQKRIGTQTQHGSRSYTERRFLGLWFYDRTTAQKWSPLMHEIEREVGVRIGHVRAGLTLTHKHFFDGKEPAVIAGVH